MEVPVGGRRAASVGVALGGVAMTRCERAPRLWSGARGRCMCKGLPKRMKLLQEKDGDRLKK